MAVPSSSTPASISARVKKSISSKSISCCQRHTTRFWRELENCSCDEKCIELCSNCFRVRCIGKFQLRVQEQYMYKYKYIAYIAALISNFKAPFISGHFMFATLNQKCYCFSLLTLLLCWLAFILGILRVGTLNLQKQPKARRNYAEIAKQLKKKKKYIARYGVVKRFVYNHEIWRRVLLF